MLKRGLLASLTKLCCLRPWLVTRADWSFGLGHHLSLTVDTITTSDNRILKNILAFGQKHSQNILENHLSLTVDTITTSDTVNRILKTFSNMVKNILEYGQKHSRIWSKTFSKHPRTQSVADQPISMASAVKEEEVDAQFTMAVTAS